MRSTGWEIFFKLSLIGAIVACNSGAPASSAAQHSLTANDSAMAQMHGMRMQANDSAFKEMQKRGQMAMGVDQNMSKHKFDVALDGGRIELQRDTPDSVDVAEIRAHIKRIQHAFADGDFSTPSFVHMRRMPGTAVMAAKKNVIKYSYHDLPLGAELRMSTKDPAAKAAITRFMMSQRTDHRAGGKDEYQRPPGASNGGSLIGRLGGRT
ncbi:MAG: hypothetical protein ABIQ55_13025 [Gemmatimonadaceae bacterium]